MHLHLKCCPAGSAEFECPSNHRGCTQARKLMAHYRRCKSARARRAGCRDDAQQQCLVCTLVARQARTSLERKANNGPNNSSKSGCSSLRNDNGALSSSTRRSCSDAAEMLPPPPRGAPSTATTTTAVNRDDTPPGPALSLEEAAAAAGSCRPRERQPRCAGGSATGRVIGASFVTAAMTENGHFPARRRPKQQQRGRSLSEPVQAESAASASNSDVPAAPDAHVVVDNRGGEEAEEEPARPRSASEGNCPIQSKQRHLGYHESTHSTGTCDTIIEEESSSVGSKD